MKMISQYTKLGLHTEAEVFDYFMDNLKDTIRTYDFFVAWDKISENVSQIEVSLNILNYLIGKSDIETEFRNLIKAHPEIVPVLPILIAVRDNKIKIADTFKGDLEYSFSRKKQYSDSEIDEIIYFSRQCGLLKIIEDKNVKNLVDYCFGVEVGLDTNARKNRSGIEMEKLAEAYIQSICDRYGYTYIPQATALKIKSVFGKTVPTDKADRHFDFAINTFSKIYLIEVNYYSGGGSKLKSVAGEFKSLFELIKQDTDVGFIWITEGKGWETAKRPLEETFDSTDYVLNLKMIEDGLLEEIISKGL
jgi:DpnII restriction endonuclease.